MPDRANKGGDAIKEEEWEIRTKDVQCVVSMVMDQLNAKNVHGFEQYTYTVIRRSALSRMPSNRTRMENVSQPLCKNEVWKKVRSKPTTSRYIRGFKKRIDNRVRWIGDLHSEESRMD